MSAVTDALQEAVTLLGYMEQCYKLFEWDVDRFGYALAGGFHTLETQCHKHQEMCAKALFLEDEEPFLDYPKSESSEDPKAMLEKMEGEEEEFLDKCKSWMNDSYGDPANFHLFQHLAKWHKKGENGNTGHLKWLKKQLRQIEDLGGLSAYLAVQATK